MEDVERAKVVRFFECFFSGRFNLRNLSLRDFRLECVFRLRVLEDDTKNRLG